MNIEIANRLLQLRKQHGFSQEELAERLGISRQSVSKWERAEASPDTDNLISLAQLYGVTLDELLGVGNEAAGHRPGAAAGQGGAAGPGRGTDGADAWTGKSWEGQAGERVHIGPDGIHVENDKERVHVSWHGVQVENDRENVHIDQNGVHANGKDYGWIKDQIFTRGRDRRKRSAGQKFPFAILAVIAFFCWGYFGHAWGLAWLVFLTIPLYHTLVAAIAERRPSLFAYPVLVTAVYLLLGLCCAAWHPGWIIFITIPLYYWLATALERRGAGRLDQEPETCYNTKED